MNRTDAVNNAVRSYYLYARPGRQVVITRQCVTPSGGSFMHTTTLPGWDLSRLEHPAPEAATFDPAFPEEPLP